jgi:hypothetical protein
MSTPSVNIAVLAVNPPFADKFIKAANEQYGTGGNGCKFQSKADSTTYLVNFFKMGINAKDDNETCNKLWEVHGIVMLYDVCDAGSNWRIKNSLEQLGVRGETKKVPVVLIPVIPNPATNTRCEIYAKQYSALSNLKVLEFVQIDELNATEVSFERFIL